MKPYVNPALRPIEDDPSKPCLDESDIPSDSLEVSESISHDNDTNVTVKKDTHALAIIFTEIPNLNQHVDDYQVTAAIDNQSIYAAEKNFQKNVKGKATYNISLNGFKLTWDRTGEEYFG